MKAFPIPSYVNKSGETHDVQNQGMELRDYFAAKAMPMVFKFAKECIEDSGDTFEIADEKRKGDMSSEIAVVAEACYIFADAMIEARKYD